MSHPMMEETDEVFLQTLYRGSELIGQGELEDARSSLEQAVSMRPDDQKARNLLGLACFKLGDYPAAETLYASLVHENPDDATLRVNLGLVHLKAGRFEEAIREFGAAVEIQPDHRRAQNYLGLAYARVGDYAQAQECFVAAGSEQMVERMGRLMAGEGEEDEEVASAAPGPLPAGSDRLAMSGNGESPAALAEEPPPAAPATPAPFDESVAAAKAPVDAQQKQQAQWSQGSGDYQESYEQAQEGYEQAQQEEWKGEAHAADHEGGEVYEQAVEEPQEAAEQQYSEPFSEEQPQAQYEQASEAPSYDSMGGEYYDEPEEPPPPTIDTSRASLPKSSWSDWVLPARLLELSDELALPSRIPAPFVISDEVVVAEVEKELLCRASGLLAMEGAIDLRPEVKRFRGRATEKPFGEGERRVLRLIGNGRIYIATRGRRFTPVRIDGADAYLSEESVFAFQETVAYENGRVPSKVSADLNLVHLRGQGVFLLETPGPLVATVVTPGLPLRVPLERLVGWTGLVTPRIVSFADEGGADDGPLTGVELAGEGRVLLTLPKKD